MKCFAVLFRLAPIAGVLMMAGAPLDTARGAPATIIRTNFVDRWLTNLVEVRIQANRFVNEYHTNWVEQATTNLVNLYATNRVSRTLTNRVLVDVFHTNVVNEYHTNNVLVDVVRTNFVTAYQTNRQTLSLTNWATVVMFKTNWTIQPLTNFVQIDLPKNSQGAAAPRPTNPYPAPSGMETLLPVRATKPADVLAVEATRTARHLPNNNVEVHLRAKWKTGPQDPLQVQQWRLERGDAGFLSFGQEQEFIRTLPVGEYKVEVKAQRQANGPVLLGRGILTVTAGEPVGQQAQAKKN